MNLIYLNEDIRKWLAENSHNIENNRVVMPIAILDSAVQDANFDTFNILEHNMYQDFENVKITVSTESLMVDPEVYMDQMNNDGIIVKDQQDFLESLHKIHDDFINIQKTKGLASNILGHLKVDNYTFNGTEFNVLNLYVPDNHDTHCLFNDEIKSMVEVNINGELFLDDKFANNIICHIGRIDSINIYIGGPFDYTTLLSFK